MLKKETSWDRLSPKYDALWVQHYSLTPARRWVHRTLQRYGVHPEKASPGQCSPPNSSLRRCGMGREAFLDVGCGTGQLLEELKKRYPQARFWGIDASGGMLEKAQSRFLHQEDLTARPDAPQQDRSNGFAAPQFLQGDVCGPVMDFFQESSFDVITCCHSFPYYKNQEAVLVRLEKLLKPEGILIFVQASINNPYDWVIMKAVEKTAAKAQYLSRKQFVAMARRHYHVSEQVLIRKKWYMPSIYGFVLTKRGLP